MTIIIHLKKNKFQQVFSQQLVWMVTDVAIAIPTA